MDLLDLSIHIVSFNTQKLLVECLQSVYKNTRRHSFEVIVVDNGSTDGSVSVLKERFPATMVIANGKNAGFAAANNQGLKLSRGRYAAFLNPDTLVFPLTFDAMIDFMDNHPEVGAAGCRLFFPDGRPQTCAGDFPTLSCMLCDLLYINRIVDRIIPGRMVTPHQYYPDWMYRELREVPVIGGACLMVRRQALNTVGFFDGDYFMYHEDIDLCYRLRKAGWKVFFIPEGGVIHYLGQSSKANRREMKMAEYKSRFLFYRKHYGYLALRAFGAICMTSCLLNVVRFLLKLATENGMAEKDEVKSYMDVMLLSLRVLGRSVESWDLKRESA